MAIVRLKPPTIDGKEWFGRINARFPKLRNLYLFNDQGLALRDAGESNHGTLTGTWQASPIGRALKLAAASSQYVELGSPILSGDLTIAMVLCRTSSTAGGSVDGAWFTRTTGNGWGLDIGNGFDSGGNTDKPHWSMFGGSPSNLAAWQDGRKQASVNPFDAALANNQWYTIVASARASAAGDQNRIGRAGSFYSNICVALALAWSRQLGDYESEDISAAPVETLFAPPSSQVGWRWTAGGTTFNQSVTATQGSTASLLRAMGKAVNANAPDLATIGRAIGKVIALTGPSSPVIRRQAGKPIAATLGSTASMVRQTAKGIAIAGSASPALAKAATKTIAPSASSSASVSATRAFLKTVSVNAASAVTAVRQAGKTVAAAAANAATMTRQTAKGVAATAASSPSVSATRAFLKTVSVAAGSAATMTRSIAKTIAAASASLFAMVRDYISGGIAPGTAVPRTGGTVTSGGGSAGTASARAAGTPATPR